MNQILIDKISIEAADKTTILQAARSAGITIPTFCVAEGLTPTGTCRLCLVAVTFADGTQKILTACDTRAEDGMVIRTDTAEVRNARRQSVALLAAICPDLPAVQRLAEEYAVQPPAAAANVPQAGCVQCGACVQACKEQSSGILRFAGKGDERIVTTPDGNHAPDCDKCSACVRYCPTAAVTQGLNLGIGEPLRRKNAARQSRREWSRWFFLSLFVVLLLMTAAGIRIQGLPNQLFSYLDPLQGLAQLVSGSGDAERYWPSLIVLALTFILGRFWCGWVCPTGTILQSFGRKGRVVKNPQWRRLKTVLFIGLILLAALGSLAIFWLDPLALLIRPFAAAFGGDFGGFSAVRADFTPLLRAGVFLLPLLLALVLNAIERGFWCRYVCPLGGMLGLCSRFAPLKRHVDAESCIACGKCAPVCPVGAIDPSREFRSDPAECVQCGECAAVCPKYAIAFHGEPLFRGNNEFDPGRRELLGTGAFCAAAAAVGIALDTNLPRPEKSMTLLPPGALRAGEQTPLTLLKQCTRCNQCMVACPQHILKPSLEQPDWTSVYTPVVDFGESYCRPDCTRCGDVCPSGAIPKIAYAEKLNAKIGLASVNTAACVQCYACVSACPYQAFEQVTDLSTGAIYPQVNPERCNGCGLCASVCPKRDDGAIVIQPPNAI